MDVVDFAARAGAVSIHLGGLGMAISALYSSLICRFVASHKLSIWCCRPASEGGGPGWELAERTRKRRTPGPSESKQGRVRVRAGTKREAAALRPAGPP